jgi:ABC-type multidrug transport system ATPase subunit
MFKEFFPLTNFSHNRIALSEHLTVRETLHYALLLKLSSNPRRKKSQLSGENARVVDRVIKLLRLTKVADTRIGSPLKRGISGGERRRLAIGTELVTQPTVLLVDEGTSGLDANSANHVMRILKQLAITTGVAVVITVHQPRANIFRMFDNLLVLHKGHQVYYGQAMKSLEYFASLGCPCPNFENPADHILDILSEPAGDGGGKEEGILIDMGEKGDKDLMLLDSTIGGASGSGDWTAPTKSGDDLIAAWKQNHEAAGRNRVDAMLREVLTSTPRVGTDIGGGYTGKGSCCGDTSTVIILLKRILLTTVRDPAIIYSRIGAACFMGALVGIIFLNTKRVPETTGVRINVLLFVMCCFSLFCLPAISRYFEDRLIFVRERAAGSYSTLSYFLASTLIEFPLLALIVLFYGAPAYWLVGLNPDPDRFLWFLLTVFCVVNTGFAWASLFAAMAKTINVAISWFMFILVYSLLLGGFIMGKKALKDSAWLTNTSYFYFGYENLIVNEFAGDEAGDAQVARMNMNPDCRPSNVGYLILMFTILRLLSFVALSLTKYSK